MPAPAPFFYLRDDEHVLARLTPAVGHGFRVFALGFTAVTLAFVAASTAVAVLLSGARLGPLAFAGYGGLVVLVALVAWRRWATTEYALTDQRLYARTGRLFTRVHFATHDRVTDVTFQQGPLERVCGVQRLIVSTAGGNVGVVGITDALALKEKAESARDAFIQGLLEQAGVNEQRAEPEPQVVDVAREPAVAAAPLPVWDGPRPTYLKAGDTPLWYGVPRRVAGVTAALRLAVPIGFLAFWSLPVIARFGGVELAVAAFVALVAGVVGVRVWQLARTEYVITDRRVYARSGIVGTTVNQLTFDKITDITYKQDVLGRLLGYSGLAVNTAGSNTAPIQMIGLVDALTVKENVERARARYLREEAA